MTLLTRDLLKRLDTIHIPSRRRLRLQNRGERTSLRKGSSLEFSDFREYMQGDDIRSIDWNVYARAERLFLKLFLEEESKPVYFIVDASTSMKFGEPSKFDFAIALAGALSYVSLARYDRPIILLARDHIFRQFSFGSLKQFFSVMARLEREQAGGSTHLTAIMKKIAISAFARGIYFVLSDFYSSDGFEGLKTLAAAGNELHCLQILSDAELHPSLRGDLRLIDSETAATSEISMTPRVVRDYSRRLAGLQQEVRKTAHQSFSSYYSISTSTDLSAFILRELRAAGIVA